MSRVKLLVVGHEGSGKTLLVEALKLIQQHGLKKYVEFITDNTNPTSGIAISKQDVKLGDKETSMTIWDFSGAEVYSTAHSYFLTERSVYLVLYNITSSFSASG